MHVEDDWLLRERAFLGAEKRGDGLTPSVKQFGQSPEHARGDLAQPQGFMGQAANGKERCKHLVDRSAGDLDRARANFEERRIRLAA